MDANICGAYLLSVDHPKFHTFIEVCVHDVNRRMGSSLEVDLFIGMLA